MKTMKMVMMGLIAAMATKGLALTSENIFGVLRVDSLQKETIISVPWLNAHTTTKDDPIKVADLVLTSNLSVGDLLYYYNGTTTFTYDCWQLTEDTEIPGNKVWTPATVVTDSWTKITEAAKDKKAARGAALFIVRNTNWADPIYLYGRYTGGAATTQVAAGSIDSKGGSQRAYTLLAPALPDDVDINAVSMEGTPNQHDYIQIGIGQQLFYREVSTDVWKWCVEKRGRDGVTYDYSARYTTIPHGQGCWYVSCGGAPTFTW